MLEWFVFKSKDVYGESFITYNVHSLIHLHQDVENYGEDLLSLSAFPFENYMQVLKKYTHNANNPLLQIIKRSYELEKSGESITHQYINDKIAIADRDSWFCLTSGEIVKITKKLTNNNFQCKTVHSKDMKFFFNEPCYSRNIDIFVANQNISMESRNICKQDIRK